MRRASVIASCLAIVFVCGDASAQLAQDKAVADAMFNEGLKLLRAGKFADACPKLAESERIDPAVGTALYLGECYERIQKLASAQVMFQEGYDLARRRGDARASVAKDHHDKIVPSTLTITIASHAQIPGMQITRDGTLISQVEIGVPLPADGGAHTIAVIAPGKKSWSASVDVPIEKGSAALTIPPLVDDAKTDSTATISVTAPSSDAAHTRRLVGIATGGAGVATLVFGSIAGTIAMLDWNASNSADNGCNSGTTACPTQHGVDLRGSAQTWATVSTTTLIIGGALAVIGAIVYFTAPKARIASAFITPGNFSFRF